MAKIREPRKKLIKKVDIMKPLNINTLGTSDDPCFGKHYDIKAPECQRCGDSELCAIVKAQKNNIAREKIEKNKSFKDLEPIKEVPSKEVKKKMKARIKEICKEPLPLHILVDDLQASFNKFGYTSIRIKKWLKVIEKKNLITIKNNTVKWKSS